MDEKLQRKVDLAKAKKKAKQIADSSNILAIDPATLCGWCTGVDEYGTWDLSSKRNESIGMKWIRFKAHLKDICKLRDIEIIAYEIPVMSRFSGGATIHHAKMVGIIEEFCEKRNIQYTNYTPSEIKKFATGKGNSGKPAVVAAAQDILGMEGEDDNMADALWIYHLAIKELYL